MAMVKQQPSQLPPHQQNPYALDVAELPFGAQTIPTRSVPIRMGSRPRQDLGAQQLPQQYARPLSRPTNDRFSPLLGADSQFERQSEHMLRRKTPNGILHAAYDGTSVEQTERPHAMKHILLPVSEHFPSSGMPQTIAQDVPMPVPQQMFDPNFGYQTAANLNTPLTPIPGDMWRTGLPFGADTLNQWNSGPNQHIQLDSVLNQFPIQTPQFLPYHQNGQAAYGFVPQPLQPSFVPTASNNPVPFGPYWPNGTYQPYLPAATRDLRFNHRYPTGWMPTQGPFDPTQSHGTWQMAGSGAPMMPNFQNPQIFSNMSHMKNDLQLLHPSHSRQTYGLNNGFQDTSLKRNLINSTPPISTPVESPRFVPNLSRITATTQSSRSSDSPAVSHDASSHSLLAEYGSNSPNAKHRDRVFKQAVDIYIELVKHLHKSRASSAAQNRGSNGHSSTRMYPRPPRQSIQDFPTPPQPVRHNSTGQITQHSRPQLHNHHRHSFMDGRDYSSDPTRNFSPSPQHTGHMSWQQIPQMSQNAAHIRSPPPSDRVRHLRRHESEQLSPATTLIPRQDHYPVQNAVAALDSLTLLCHESEWTWIDGLLLGGSLAYALADYSKAYDWYSKILGMDPRHVEAMSNLAATLMAMGKKQDAEQFWQRAVKLRPSYFEAVEHLIGLLCNDNRSKDSIMVIEYVERSLRCKKREATGGDSPCPSENSDKPVFDYENENDFVQDRREPAGADQPGFGSSGYSIPGTDNGRIHTLVHARGNLLYAAGDIVGAAKAFEDAVLITVGRHFGTIEGLVKHILMVLSREVGLPHGQPADDPLLIPPSFALETLKFCFPPNGSLPGLRDIPAGSPGIKAAMATTSNSLLSLAKIFQDGMASSSPRQMPFKMSFGVREILALYYLSLALQQSPSTANNVGILLAGLQQTVTPKMLAILQQDSLPSIPGVVAGTGVHMALAYYNYGLNLDRRHAHLYTNLGSLLKDLGQLQTAIRMYEEAVRCDQKFDIALANLANAVKDQGRIADAINYYQRAVDASPDFAEAVCGLANALNSVCGWQGRGGIAEANGSRDRWHVDKSGMLKDATQPGAVSSGWIKRVVDLVDKQLAGGERWGQGVITSGFINQVVGTLALTIDDPDELNLRSKSLMQALHGWSGRHWEGQRAVRLLERIAKRLTWQWYHDTYVTPRRRPSGSYDRPTLPPTLPVPAAPTVLPFHTFTSPMSAKQIRQISQRNGLRISCSTLKAPWLPTTVSHPPAPPNPYLKVGYVSSDFNNHPLAHLMQSVFGMHDQTKVKAYCYATTTSDNSIHRQQIERESPVFYDASSWSAEKLVNRILDDGIHILVNLNGYTRGARNEVFAARPAPIQMSFMGFAGTLGAEWCDYLLADETAVPPDTLRPWRRNVELEDHVIDESAAANRNDWIYGENIIYCRDTFFCCDHRQSAPDSKEKNLNWEEEQATRWVMRKEIFPDLPNDAIILGNFNQLYKIEPTTFRTWLRILDRVPKAVLWLLRFPDLGEQYLKKTALDWAGAEVASRVIFTDVAPKQQHISRARVCDLFLDTPECNAHTTAADILWSGTPLLTYPRYKYKMCSRMAASILKGALPKNTTGRAASEDLIAGSEQDYEDKAARLARGLMYDRHRPRGRLADLRKLLWEGRWSSGLFDTRRWVRDLEEAYGIAWRRWVDGEGGDIWLDRERAR